MLLFLMDICVLPHITHQYGTRSELVVAEYLVARGFYVFSPVVHQQGPIDLIAINEDRDLFFIDVKTAGLRTKPNRKTQNSDIECGPNYRKS